VTRRKQFDDDLEKSLETIGRDELNVLRTGGEVFADGSFLELTRNSQGEIELLHWSGGASTNATKIFHNGNYYSPPDEAAHVRHLPTRPIPFGSTQSLFDELHQFLTRSLGLARNDATLLTFF
jgi:hypothetical protein